MALSLSYQHRELLYSLFTVCVLVCAMLSARPSCSKDALLVGRPHAISVEYDVIKIISVESQLRPLYDVQQEKQTKSITLPTQQSRLLVNSLCRMIVESADSMHSCGDFAGSVLSATVFFYCWVFCCKTVNLCKLKFCLLEYLEQWRQTHRYVQYTSLLTVPQLHNRRLGAETNI